MKKHLLVHTALLGAPDTNKIHKCDPCGTSFSLAKQLEKHFYVTHLSRKFECDICNKTFTNSGILNEHMNIIHHIKEEERKEEEENKCETCDKVFTNVGDYLVHVQSKHFIQSMKIDHEGQLESKSSIEEEILITKNDKENSLINPNYHINNSNQSPWNGLIDMQKIGRVHIKAHQVFGCVGNIADTCMENNISIKKTISGKALFNELGKVEESNANKEMALVSLLPKSQDESSNYLSIYNHLKSRNMVGFVEDLGEMIKKCYIFPLIQEEIIHPVLLAMTLDGPELDDDQDDLLWALIITH